MIIAPSLSIILSTVRWFKSLPRYWIFLPWGEKKIHKNLTQLLNMRTTLFKWREDSLDYLYSNFLKFNIFIAQSVRHAFLSRIYGKAREQEWTCGWFLHISLQNNKELSKVVSFCFFREVAAGLWESCEEILKKRLKDESFDKKRTVDLSNELAKSIRDKIKGIFFG